MKRAVHPVVEFLYEEIKFSPREQGEIIRSAGVASSSYGRWVSGRGSPTVDRLAAVLGELGYELVVIAKKDS